MAADPYCGKCHTWLTELFTGRWVCDCTLSGHSSDNTKDPNCHNANHEHYDPQSPIVLSRKAEREAEEPNAIGVYDLDHFVATGEYIPPMPPPATVADSQPVFSETLDVEEEGLLEEAIREDAGSEVHTYEVAVFESATGRLLGWRPLREPKIDEKTRVELDAILEEANEKVED